MFNVGSGELLVILLVALVVLGPDKLPEAARKIGAVMRELRRMSEGFQQEMRQAMDLDASSKPVAVRDESGPERREPDSTPTADAAPQPNASERSVEHEDPPETDHGRAAPPDAA